MKWEDIYRKRVTTAEEAVGSIKSGDHVWIHPGCNTPKRLVDAMERAPSDVAGPMPARRDRLVSGFRPQRERRIRLGLSLIDVVPVGDPRARLERSPAVPA